VAKFSGEEKPHRDYFILRKNKGANFHLSVAFFHIKDTGTRAIVMVNQDKLQ
jgi:hypothetical protein